MSVLQSQGNAQDVFDEACKAAGLSETERKIFWLYCQDKGFLERNPDQKEIIVHAETWKGMQVPQW